MNKLMKEWRYYWISLLLLVLSQEAVAQDSYRWLTVNINTLWIIFIFLLPLVLVPLILMAILHWRFAKPSDEESDGKPEDKKT